MKKFILFLSIMAAASNASAVNLTNILTAVYGLFLYDGNPSPQNQKLLPNINLTDNINVLNNNSAPNNITVTSNQSVIPSENYSTEYINDSETSDDGNNLNIFSEIKPRLLELCYDVNGICINAPYSEPRTYSPSNEPILNICFDPKHTFYPYPKTKNSFVQDFKLISYDNFKNITGYYFKDDQSLLPLCKRKISNSDTMYEVGYEEDMYFKNITFLLDGRTSFNFFSENPQHGFHLLIENREGIRSYFFQKNITNNNTIIFSIDDQKTIVHMEYYGKNYFDLYQVIYDQLKSLLYTVTFHWTSLDKTNLKGANFDDPRRKVRINNISKYNPLTQLLPDCTK